MGGQRIANPRYSRLPVGATFWWRGELSDELPAPQDLATEAVTKLEAAVDDLRGITAKFEREAGVEK